MPDPETPKSEVKTPAPGKPRAPRQPVPKRLRRQAQTARARAVAGGETPDPESVEQPETPKRAKRQSPKAKRPPGRAAKAKATDAKARRAKQRAHNAREAARTRARPVKARKGEASPKRPRQRTARTKKPASPAALPSPGQARAQVDKRDAFFEAARPHSPYLGVVTGEGRFVMPTGERLGRGLFSKRGRPEFRVLARAAAIIEALLGQKAVVGRQFVDVGANIGTSTIPALLVHRFGSAVACEPGGDNFRVLRANIALNELDERVRSVRVAVSDRAGSVNLVAVEGDNEKSWIALKAAQIRRFEKSREREAAEQGQDVRELAPVTVSKVKAVTLDDLVEQAVIDLKRAGLLWIDT